MNNYLSIVLPCYNPREDWARVVMDNVAFIEQSVGPVEVVVVNDGLTRDLTEDVEFLNVHLKSFRFISYPENKGKGFATRQGLQAATGHLIIYTDIDFPYTRDSFLDLYEALKHNNIVIGIKDIEYYKTVPLLRKWVSKSLRWMSAKLLNIHITDTQCGLKGMHNSAKEIWLMGKVNRYLFDLEAIYNGEKAGYKIVALPVRLREGVVFSKLKFSILFSEIMNFLFIMPKIFSTKTSQKK